MRNVILRYISLICGVIQNHSQEGRAQLKEQIGYYQRNAAYIFEGLKSMGYTVSGAVSISLLISTLLCAIFPSYPVHTFPQAFPYNALLGGMVCLAADHRRLPAFLAGISLVLGLNANWKSVPS